MTEEKDTKKELPEKPSEIALSAGFTLTFILAFSFWFEVFGG